MSGCVIRDCITVISSAMIILLKVHYVYFDTFSRVCIWRITLDCFYKLRPVFYGKALKKISSVKVLSLKVANINLQMYRIL